MRNTAVAFALAASLATTGTVFAQTTERPVAPQPREAQGSAAVANPTDVAQIPSTTSSATTRGADMPGTAPGAVGDNRFASGYPDREAPTGMRRWLAMPFPLVLWLLLSPLAFALMTRGPGPTSREVHPTVRTDLRTDTRTVIP
jgi:hypothetical protein